MKAFPAFVIRKSYFAVVGVDDLLKFTQVKVSLVWKIIEFEIH